MSSGIDRTAPCPAAGGAGANGVGGQKGKESRRRGCTSRERSAAFAGQAMISGGTVISARAIARFSSRSRVKLLIHDGGKRRYSSSLAA